MSQLFYCLLEICRLLISPKSGNAYYSIFLDNIGQSYIFLSKAEFITHPSVVSTRFTEICDIRMEINCHYMYLHKIKLCVFFTPNKDISLLVSFFFSRR